YEIDLPAGASAGTPVMVLLHGRGADRHDLFSLRPRLPADWIVLAPEAPFPAAPWGYGPGSAWYKFLGRNRPEPDSFSASIDALHEFVAAIPALTKLTPGPITLVGFSQGGTLAMAYALTHPDAAASIINLSGFLADHTRVAVNKNTVGQTRFFWGHGRRDPNIPFELATEGQAWLRQAGTQLESRAYDIGHWIDPRELRDALDWLI
ncbi:MAG TPA: alpha/beta fold hydrolase, partial [Longimicrobiales bacterium]|nr:alpha/beta fold hydrolase [Longimicrobiales bacterium]